MKNKQIAGILYILATMELSLGVYFFASEAANPGQYFHLIMYVNVRVQELKGNIFTSCDSCNSSGRVSDMYQRR